MESTAVPKFRIIVGSITKSDTNMHTAVEAAKLRMAACIYLLDSRKIR